jgi:S-adenosylmethionine decarboxylase
MPASYTLTPSEGTPHLTINREATIDLDSSNAFEGKHNVCLIVALLIKKQVPRNCSKYGSLQPPIASQMEHIRVD